MESVHGPARCVDEVAGADPFPALPEVEFQIGERRERVRAGDFIYAPGGAMHAFHGVSQVAARMLIFDVPAHAEAFFRELHREVTEVPRDLAKLPAIGARHGLLFASRSE